MRKLILTMAAMAFVLMGVTSCSKEGGNEGDEGFGTLTISLSLDGGSSDTRATASTAKPITTWDNLSNMMILFVSGNVVADARTITVPTGSLTGQTSVFQNIRANTSGWDCYIVGNYPTSWTAGNVIGKNITTDFQFTAPLSSSYATSPFFKTGTIGYDEVSEMFVAKRTGIVVNPDANNDRSGTPFKLARAVSLIRVRIDQSPGDNNKIDFSSAMFAVRRATPIYTMSGTYTYGTPDGVVGIDFPGNYLPVTPNADNVFFKAKAMRTDATPSGYTGSGLLAGTITLWNDYMIWPGGSNDPLINTGKFDIVVSGVTRDGTYESREGSILGAGARVYWDAQVQQKMGPNQILELIITLETPGRETFPEVGSFGKLEIGVDLLNWGDIIPVPMPM